MDEPVRRRSFVRLVASEAVQNAGRMAALSGVAAGMVAHGVASLADATGTSDEASPPTPPATSPPGPVSSATPIVPGAPAPPTAPARPATLDAATIATLTTSSHLLLVVNRPRAGPFLNRYPFRLQDGVVRIESRTSSAMAQHVRHDQHVTLLFDEPASGQRLMVFGTARLLEGGAAAAEDTAADAAAKDTTPIDHDRAVILVQPSHAIRMPL